MIDTIGPTIFWTCVALAVGGWLVFLTTMAWETARDAVVIPDLAPLERLKGICMGLTLFGVAGLTAFVLIGISTH